MSLDINAFAGLGSQGIGLIPGLNNTGIIQDFGDINSLLGLTSETKNTLANSALLYGEMLAISTAYRLVNIGSQSGNNMDIKSEKKDILDTTNEFITSEKSSKDITDTSLGQNKKNISNISAEYIRLSQVEKTTVDNNLSNYKNNTSNKNIPDLFDKVQVSVDNYLSSEKPNESNYDGIIKSETSDINYGYTDPNVQTLPDNYNSFPIFGKPFDNLGKIISNNMNNNVVFNSEINSFNDKKYKGSKIFKGWAIKNTSGNWVSDPINTFTRKTPFSDFISKAVQNEHIKSGKQPPGTVKFFIEQLHGRYGNGDPFKKGEISTQMEVIGDKNYSNRTVFAAYIDSYNESYGSSWNGYSFIGRGEDVPIFKSTKRTITISFSIIADYSIDLLTAMEAVYADLNFTDIYGKQLEDILNAKQDWGLGYVGLPSYDASGKIIGSHIPGKYSDTTETLWNKLTFLAQCMYPYYRTDGKMKEQPMIRMRLADHLDVVGYIENYTVDTSEFDNMFDLNPTAIGNIPFAAKVSLTISVFHDNEPSSNFYGFYHRREFDTGTMDPKTGANIAPNSSKGVTSLGSQKHSPLSFTSTYLNEKLTDTPKILNDSDALMKNSIAEFNNNFSDLSKMGINLSDQIRKDKITKAMKSFVRVSEVANQLRAFYGLGQVDKSGPMPNDLSNLANKNQINNSSASINNFGSVVDNINAAGVNSAINSNQLNTMTTNTPKVGSVKKPGANKINNDTVKNAYDLAKSINDKSNSPKTFGDIINNINNK